MNDLTTLFQKKRNSNTSRNESEIKGKPITELPSTSGINDSHRSEGIVKSNTVKVKDCNAADNLSYVSATEKSCKRPDVSSIYGVPEDLSSNHRPEKPYTTTGGLSSNSHGPENPHTITRGISSSNHEPEHPHKRTRLSDHSCESMPNVTRPNGTFKSTMQLSVKICVQKSSKNIKEEMLRDRCRHRTLPRKQVKCFKPKADDTHNGNNFEHVQHTTTPANGLETTLRTLSDNSPEKGLEPTLRTLSDNSPENGLEPTLRTLSDNSPANGLEPTLRTLSDNSPANGLETTFRTLSDNSPANGLETTLRTLSDNSPANGLETTLRTLSDNSPADSRVEDILLKPVENIHSHYLGTTESVGMTGKMNCSGSPNAHYDNVKIHNNSLSKLPFISDKCAGVDICTFTSMLDSEEINPCQSNVPKLNSDIPSTKLHSTILEGMSDHITDIYPSPEGKRGSNGVLASFGTDKGRAVLKNKGKLFGKDLTDKSISTKLSTTADNRNGADCTSTDDITNALAVAIGKRRNNMPTRNPTNNLQPIEFDESFNSIENECNKCILFPLERQSKPRTNLSEQVSNGLLKEVIGQTENSVPENDLKVQGLSSVHTLAAINYMTEEDLDISLRLDGAQPGKDESSNSSSGRLSTLNSNKMQQTDSNERDSVVGNRLPAMGSNTSTKEIKQPVDNFLNSSITDPVALNGRLRNSSTSYDERSGLRGKHIKSSDKRLNDVTNAYPSYIKPSNDETNVSSSSVRPHDDVKSIPTTQESTDHNPDDHRPPTSSEMTSNELINERFQPAEVHVHTHSASHNGSHTSAYFPNLAQEPNSQTHSQGDPNPRDIANGSNHRRLATSDIASGWTDSIHHSLLSSQPLSSTNMNNHSMSLRVRHSVHLNEQTSHIRANVNEEYVIDLSKGQIDPEVTRDLPPVLNEENVHDEILQIHGASNIQLVENSSAEDRQLEPLLALIHNQSASTHTWSTIMSYYPWGTNYGHVVFPERDGCYRYSNAVNTILFNCHCKVLCALCARQAFDCPECGDSVLYFTVF